MITQERLLVTRHAKERMDERGIGRPVLEAVLAHGEMRWSARGLQVVCELLGWRAVLDPLRATVITLYEVGETRRYAQ